MKLFAPILATTFPFVVCTDANVLPDFDNYTKIPGVSFEDASNVPGSSNYVHMHAPDTSHSGVLNYNSTRPLNGHPEILTAICDVFADACDWHNGDGNAIGKRTPNASVSTYLKNSKGTIQDGSVPGSRYFVNDGDEWCTQTKAWAQPASVIATQCDMDTECDGFIMRNDNTYGSLCAYTTPSYSTTGTYRNSTTGTGCYFKLS
jgi:hypothetical protein